MRDDGHLDHLTVLFGAGELVLDGAGRLLCHRHLSLQLMLVIYTRELIDSMFSPTD